MNKLTVKQHKFCDEYIKSGNATDAAIKAGYSAKTAKVIGNENLTKPYLKAYIDKRLKQLESETIAGAREVLEYLSSVVRGKQTESVATAKCVYSNVPVSAKDRIVAAKEILKRYPSDPMTKAQLRKTVADAKVAEARAKMAEKLDGVEDNKLDQLMEKLVSENDKMASKKCH